MGSATTDRRMGLTGDKGVKAPVACATTANITLSGEQSIDGVVTSTSRVLVKNQTDATQNGVYDSSSAAWTRAIDCDGNQDLVNGTMFLVTGGSINGGMFYQVSASNPVTIGTSAITFAPSLTVASSALVFNPAGTGAVPRSLQTKMRDIVSAKDFGCAADGVTNDHDGLQYAITYCSANHTALLLDGGFLVNSTLQFPTNASGCNVVGASNRSYVKFTTAGNLFSATSTDHLQIRNLTLIGPSSATNCTAIYCAPSNYTAGTFYNCFEDITIEGFMYGMNLSGLCNSRVNNINMGLSKSGLFAGGDNLATPLIGLLIGTTMLDVQFNDVTIFATQRCLQQSTSSQLVEGLYFTNCTFDLHFNTGTSTNQSVIHIESGQDIKFTSCWFTNSAKYTAAGYSDFLLDIFHTPGAITAPLVGLEFNGCTFFGNGLKVVMNGTADNQISFVNNIVYLWSDLGNAQFTSCGQGLVMTGNLFKVVGSSAGAGVYDLNSVIVAFSSCNFALVSNNLFMGNQASIRTVANGYVSVSGCNNFKMFGNTFPVQTTLTPGSEVVVTGGSDVVIIGEQQTQGRQFVVTLNNALYSGNGTTIASINTGLSKPRMAIVEVNFGSVNVTGSGYMTLNQGSTADQSMLIPATGGNLNVMFTKVLVVNGTVTLAISGATAFTPTANNSNFRITFI